MGVLSVPENVRAKLVDFGFWTLIGMVLWPVMVTIGPTMEGRFFPVIENSQITRVVEQQDGKASNVWGRSDKVRECTFLSLEWYYTTGPNSNVLVPVDILEPSKVRGGGWFSFGPWKVHLRRDQIRKESFAIAKHRCHLLWVTETHFWP